MSIKIAGRITCVFVLMVLFAAAPMAQAQTKTKIESLDDLPRFSYPVEGSVVDIITSDEAFAEFAADIRADIEGVLAEYEIDDPATLQVYYRILAQLDLMDGNYDEALARVDESRAIETKEAAKLMSGLFAEAWVAAHAEFDPATDFETFATAFATQLDAGVAELPWDIVQDEIKNAKGRAEISSENFILGVAQSQVDPAVSATGEVSSDLVPTVVALRFALEVAAPLNREVIDVYSRAIAENQVEKNNIWYAREVVLGRDEGKAPVTIGIWDAGTDVSVFDGQLWFNEAEKADGLDNDHNGFVDDINGIAFDMDGNQSPFLLHPVGDMEDRVDDAMNYTKGFADLTASIDSDEASELKLHIASLEPEKVNEFIEELNFAALYMHGTHVAGIAVEDNPFARVLVARISFDYHNPPKALTVETARTLAGSFAKTIRYFQANNVRVVNMSWGLTLKEIESGLEANGIGESPEARGKLAKQILGIFSDALRKGISGAEEILFVAAAGNSDNDVEFDQMVPSSFDLPNLLVVGGVDQAGDPTGFTSQGKNVRLYANGFEVDSYVPGGGRMAMSGTSMSSPGVVNLAAKIFAVAPDLTPSAVIDLIVAGATPRDGNENFLLLHPKDTMNRLETKEQNVMTREPPPLPEYTRPQVD